MKNFRLLISKDTSAYMNMAIDEAVLNHVNKNLVPPTLRLYSWKPSAVSIGYFQSLADEVDLGMCKSLGVDYVRRITGGGAVYHDKEITYSFIIKKSSRFVPEGILDSYKFICEGIIESLRILDITAEFVPLNDIIVNGKKISGNAQTRKLGCILQHGTILLDLDVEKMFKLLLIPDEKLRDKMITVASERVTSLNKILGKQVDFDTGIKTFVKGFSRAFNIEFVKSELLDSELSMAKKLAWSKYSKKEWNFMR